MMTGGGAHSVPGVLLSCWMACTKVLVFPFLRPSSGVPREMKNVRAALDVVRLPQGRQGSWNKTLRLRGRRVPATLPFQVHLMLQRRQVQVQDRYRAVQTCRDKYLHLLGRIGGVLRFVCIADIDRS
jgi:hypothetical protein